MSSGRGKVPAPVRHLIVFSIISFIINLFSSLWTLGLLYRAPCLSILSHRYLVLKERLGLPREQKSVNQLVAAMTTFTLLPTTPVCVTNNSDVRYQQQWCILLKTFILTTIVYVTNFWAVNKWSRSRSDKNETKPTHVVCVT